MPAVTAYTYSLSAQPAAPTNVFSSVNGDGVFDVILRAGGPGVYVGGPLFNESSALSDGFELNENQEYTFRGLQYEGEFGTASQLPHQMWAMNSADSGDPIPFSILLTPHSCGE